MKPYATEIDRFRAKLEEKNLEFAAKETRRHRAARPEAPYDERRIFEAARRHRESLDGGPFSLARSRRAGR